VPEVACPSALGNLQLSSVFGGGSWPGTWACSPSARRLERLCLHARVSHGTAWPFFRRIPARFPGRAFAALRCALPARHTDASCGDGPVSPLSVVSGLRVRIPDEPLPERVIGQLETIRQAQFVENGGQVVVHCCLADKQALRNRPVFRTFSDERDDLRAPGA
jgi:hypothetical protein